MSELLARLEEASEGTAELDATITAWQANAIVKPYPPSDDFGPHDHWQFWSEDGKHFLGSEGRFKVEPVTRSIDAAVTLAQRVLPDLFFWNIKACPVGNSGFVANNKPPMAGYWSAEAEGATPALALCAAIIKARMDERVPKAA